MVAPELQGIVTLVRELMDEMSICILAFVGRYCIKNTFIVITPQYSGFLSWKQIQFF